MVGGKCGEEECQYQSRVVIPIPRGRRPGVRMIKKVAMRQMAARRVCMCMAWDERQRGARSGNGLLGLSNAIAPGPVSVSKLRRSLPGAQQDGSSCRPGISKAA